MYVTLQEILSDSTEKTRNSTTGSLDNNKRTRGVNRVLQDLQGFADWSFTRRSKTFEFVEGTYEYSLEDDVECVCLANDGTTSVPDFKNPYDLRPEDKGSLRGPLDPKVVRENIRLNRFLNEYAIDGDTLIIGYAGGDCDMTLDYYSLAMAQNQAGEYQLEFNPDDVTLTDTLLGGIGVRRAVVQGTTYELFEMIGGKSERDRTDSYKHYETQRSNLYKRYGRALRRPTRVFNFARGGSGSEPWND